MFNAFASSIVAAAAVAWVVLISGQRQGPSGLCVGEHAGVPHDVGCYFSESYFEARSKFRQRAEAAGAALHVLEVMPDVDSSYTIDIAVLEGGGPGLVVSSSGVHGVEGYAGSAVQLAYLAQRAATGSSGDDPTMVLVHAVNPFGMAHFRRWNERNVDLNRNALHADEWPALLARDPNVAGYEDFSAPLFNPPRAPTVADASIKVLASAATNIARFGFLHLKRAMVTAQYHDPRGIFYGGQELQSSHALLWDFMGRFRDKARPVWVDVHTGLGAPGHDTLLVETTSGGAGIGRATAAFPGAEVQVTGAGADEAGGGAVGAGYELTRGAVDAFYGRRFEKDPVLFVTQEFGTVPGVLVARALVLENAAFHHSPDAQPHWAEYTRDAFYVRSRDWKEAVVGRGTAILDQAEAYARG